MIVFSMDPNNQNPQVDSSSMDKLEEDLKTLNEQSASNPQQAMPVTVPAAPLEQNPQVAPPALTIPTVDDQPPVMSPPTIPYQPQEMIPTNGTDSKKSSPLMITAIILAVIAVLAVVAYIVGSKLLTTRSKPVACTLDVKICPDGTSVGRIAPNCEYGVCPVAVATPDPAVNWKTYTNVKYNFSFKYPSDWEILDKFEGPLMIAPSANVASVSSTLNGTTLPETGKQLASTLTVYNNLENTSVASNDYWNVIKTLMQVNGVTAQKYISTNIKDSPNGLYVAGNKTVTVVFSLDGAVIDYELRDEKYMTIFDQIVSTFKFAQATPSVSPTASPSSSPTTNP